LQCAHKIEEGTIGTTNKESAKTNKNENENTP
jgi:hypothetical protein